MKCRFPFSWSRLLCSHLVRERPSAQELSLQARERWHSRAIRTLTSLALCFTLLACTPPAADKPVALKELRKGALRGHLVQPSSSAEVGLVDGDVALESPTLSVVVRGAAQSAERGAIVAIRQPHGSTHDWESLRPLLALDEVLHELQVRAVRLAEVSRRPAIVVDAVVETESRYLFVQRTFSIGNVHNALRIGTRVHLARGPAPREMRIVERVAFGGGTPIAPLHGPLQADAPVEVEWLARTIERTAIVVGPLAGEARVIGYSVDHGRSDLIRFSDVWFPARVESAGTYVAEACVTASQAGLGQAVRALGWMRGKPFAEAVAMLSTNPPDAQVEVVEATTGRFVVAATPDEQRRAILPLPDGALSVPLAVSARAGGVEASDRMELTGPPYEPVILTIPESSKLLLRVSQATTGEPLPARVRILPLRGTRALDLGPDGLAAGAIDTLIVAGGRSEISLPAGYYRVIVTHGPEWTVLDQSIELGVGKRVELTARLERAIDPGAWIPCELHVHQAPSPDSRVTLEDRVASLVAEGIAFAVPTDHNHVTDLSAAIAAQPLWGLASVPGVEVTTDAPIFGHFNVYPFPLDPTAPGQGAPEYRGLTPAQLFGSLHALAPDAVVQVNHPRLEGGIGYFDVAEYEPDHDHGNPLWSDDFDALEVWNGFDLARWENMQRVFAEWLGMLEHGHRIVATGGSDSHTIRSEGAGYPRTYVRAPLAGVAPDKQLVGALREGRAFVTSGPFLTARIGDAGIGDRVILQDKSVSLDVFVQVAAWMQVSTLRVYLGSKVLRQVPLGPPSSSNTAGRRYQRTLRLTVDRPGPLVVTVEGDASLEPVVARRGVKPFAFTNPIWLVAGPETNPVAAPPDLPELAPAR